MIISALCLSDNDSIEITSFSLTTVCETKGTAVCRPEHSVRSHTLACFQVMPTAASAGQP